jgi:hypothetical protein
MEKIIEIIAGAGSERVALMVAVFFIAAACAAIRALWARLESRDRELEADLELHREIIIRFLQRPKEFENARPDKKELDKLPIKPPAKGNIKKHSARPRPRDNS